MHVKEVTSSSLSSSSSSSVIALTCLHLSTMWWGLAGATAVTADDIRYITVDSSRVGMLLMSRSGILGSMGR